jgi:hypothetical protein
MQSTRSLATEYGVNVRTIRRWKKKGAPWDSKPQMVEFIRQQSRRGVQRLSVEVPGDIADTKADVSPSISVDEGIPLSAGGGVPLDMTEGLGLGATLDRYRQAELHAAMEYQQAIGTREAGAAFNRWIICTDQLRKVEASAIEIGKETGDLVSLTETVENWNTALLQMKEALDAIPARMNLELEGLDALTIEQKLKKEVARVYESLAILPRMEPLK